MKLLLGKTLRNSIIWMGCVSSVHMWYVNRNVVCMCKLLWMEYEFVSNKYWILNSVESQAIENWSSISKFIFRAMNNILALTTDRQSMCVCVCCVCLACLGMRTNMLENEKLNEKGECINKNNAEYTFLEKWTAIPRHGLLSYIRQLLTQLKLFRIQHLDSTDEVIKSELDVFAWQTEIESKRIRMLIVQFEMLICFRSVRFVRSMMRVSLCEWVCIAKSTLMSTFDEIIIIITFIAFI